jgi:hypothetical protein
LRTEKKRKDPTPFPVSSARNIPIVQLDLINQSCTSQQKKKEIKNPEASLQGFFMGPEEHKSF